VAFASKPMQPETSLINTNTGPELVARTVVIRFGWSIPERLEGLDETRRPSGHDVVWSLSSLFPWRYLLVRPLTIR